MAKYNGLGRVSGIILLSYFERMTNFEPFFLNYGVVNLSVSVKDQDLW